MKKRGYIKEFEVHDIHRVRKVTVQLLGRVNDCKALTYRQDLKAKDIEEYKTRMLPTRQIVHWRNYLKFLEDAQLTSEAKDLICRLLCHVEHCLGITEQFKVHPWTRGGGKEASVRNTCG